MCMEGTHAKVNIMQNGRFHLVLLYKREKAPKHIHMLIPILHVNKYKRVVSLRGISLCVIYFLLDSL